MSLNDVKCDFTRFQVFSWLRVFLVGDLITPGRNSPGRREQTGQSSRADGRFAGFQPPGSMLYYFFVGAIWCYMALLYIYVLYNVICCFSMFIWCYMVCIIWLYNVLHCFTICVIGIC